MSGYSSSAIQSEILDLWNEGNMNSCPKDSLKNTWPLETKPKDYGYRVEFPRIKVSGLYNEGSDSHHVCNFFDMVIHEVRNFMS